MSCFVTLIAMSFPATVLAGPFGFEMGQSVAQLKSSAGLTKDDTVTYGYRATTPPSPHPDFKQYMLLVTPKHGLCRIVAVTEPLMDTAKRDAPRRKYLDLQDALVRRYGDPTIVNGPPTSSQENANESMSRNAEGGQKWWAYWSSRRSELPDKIASFELKLNATKDDARLYLSLTYDFTNADECIQENQTATDTSL